MEVFLLSSFNHIFTLDLSLSIRIMVNEDKNMIDDIMNDNDLSREEKYNMLENMGIEPRQILDNEEEATAYQLADGTYAIVQAGKGFGGDLECKCFLPEQTCKVCANTAKQIYKKELRLEND